MTGRLARAATVALLLGAAAALAGCGVVREVGPAQDTFATWSDTPLAPDPNLARQALEEHSSCRPLPDDAGIRLLLQDRRTSATAAFLVGGANTFGSCLVSEDGSSHGGHGPAPEPMTGRISIDDNGNGQANGIVLRQLGGRVAADATKVVIELDDGASVVASLGNGWWLAWWPGVRFARTVTAFGVDGAEIDSLEVPEV